MHFLRGQGGGGVGRIVNKFATIAQIKNPPKYHVMLSVGCAKDVEVL